MISCEYSLSGRFQPLWKIWKSVGIILPNISKNKNCSKPPSSNIWGWIKTIEITIWLGESPSSYTRITIHSAQDLVWKKLRGMCRRLRRIKLRRVRQAREGRRRVSGRGRGSSWCRCLGKWRGKQGQTEGAWPIEMGWNGYVTSNSCDKLCHVGTIISQVMTGNGNHMPPTKMVTGGMVQMTLFYPHWLLYDQCNLDELVGPCPPLKLNHWLKIGFIKSREPWIIYPWRIHGAIFVVYTVRIYIYIWYVYMVYP